MRSDPGKLDAKTRAWLREIVKQHGGDREGAAQWLRSVVSIGIRTLRALIAAAMDDATPNPSLAEEIEKLRAEINENGARMKELLERVAREQREEKARVRQQRSPGDRRRKARFLQAARRQAREDNPTVSQAEIDAAAERFETFTGQPAGKAQLLEIPEPTKTTVVLGELSEISYVTSKQGGGKVEYVHRFGVPRPKLLADPTGKALFIAGGKFKINDRGIVG